MRRYVTRYSNARMTRAEEKLMWQTYWRLRRNPLKTCTEEERKMYSSAGYLLATEKYTSVRATNEEFFDLQTFREELAKLPCKRH